MENLTTYRQLIAEFGYQDLAHLVTTHEYIDIIEIANNGRLPGQKLPRIAFFGLFNHMSMTEQRKACKRLGFESYASQGLGTLDESKTNALANQWRAITGGLTKLIVLGDVVPPGRFDFTDKLYKKLKNQIQPEVIRYQIPIMFESEFIKILPDYSNIGKTTKLG